MRGSRGLRWPGQHAFQQLLDQPARALSLLRRARGRLRGRACGVGVGGSPVLASFITSVIIAALCRPRAPRHRTVRASGRGRSAVRCRAQPAARAVRARLARLGSSTGLVEPRPRYRAGAGAGVGQQRRGGGGGGDQRAGVGVERVVNGSRGARGKGAGRAGGRERGQRLQPVERPA